MRRHLWKIKELNPRAKDLAEAHDISAFLVQVFLNRGIKEEEFNSFLNPSSLTFHSPFLLPDIEKAARRIKDAAAKKEKVLVFGDYDVDGITSLAIFHEFAAKFPGIFSFYIPHRVKEGYGLNKGAVKKAAKNGTGLIIAFDCGTNANEEIELARSLNIDVIVVDHHHCKEGLTKPFAFVNPKRKDSNYPFSDLSAGALSFKLLQVLTDSDCRQVLDLAALSIVCDVAPLRGENRALLKVGLEIIRKTKRPSIKALCKAGGIKQENIDIFHMGYVLGPRINASGRVAHAKDSLNLFLTNDEAKAIELASKLNGYNKLRKEIGADILREAEEAVNGNVDGNSVIVVSGENWNTGVLGIVASRLADKYFRPSFVFSFDQDMGKGSARSIQNVHLMDFLDKCSDSLLLYGGHSKAAGINIKKSELDNFREKINSLIKEELSPEDFIPSIDIDAVLPFESIEMNLVEDLERMKPYGEGNAKPLFAACNISKKSAPKKINSYYSLWLSNEKRTFEGVVYDKDILALIDYAGSFDIAFSLQMNYYHNAPKLIIRACRLSDGKG